MARKFNGDCTANARIKIDYRGKNTTVKFSYPDKHNQVHGSLFSYIIMIWIFIWVLGFVMYYQYDDLQSYGSIEEYTYCVNENWNESLYDPYISLRYGVCNQTIPSSFTQIKNDFNLNEIIIILLLILPPILIYYPFKKKWDKLYPKVQGFLGKKKLKIFSTKDVIEKEGKIYCEIPLFYNVVFNYKATKEFSKYLEYFEIKEYNFKFLEKVKDKKTKKRKHKVNEFYWYAKFYFSQVPKTGKLKVLFK